VKLNVTFLDFSTSRAVIIFSSLRFRFRLYAITTTWPSVASPKLIISTMYSTLDPGVVFAGPSTFLTITIFSSCAISIVVSFVVEVALRLVHMLSLFSSVSFT